MARLRRHDENAFPFRQLLILGICRICEPIAFMSIFPYIYYMIESFHITTDSNRIAFFAGLVTSVFAGAECLGAGFWGRLSDKVGRKPVLLTGLAGTGVSMIMFGFAPNLAVALLARALGGALNGNIGVLQTTVNEVVKVEAHQPRAYAIMPSVWCLGAFIGSGLGGSLADPVRNYPHVFSPGTIFETFPYLLTNLVCAGVVVFSMLVGILFLEETHEDKKHRRDVGLEIGNWIINRCMVLTTRESATDIDGSDYEKVGETETLIEDLPPDYRSAASSPELTPTTPVGLPPPVYRSVEGSPRTSLSDNVSDSDMALDVEEALSQAQQKLQCRHGATRAFTRQVVLNIFGFGILAYHTISAEQLLPVLLSMPASDAPVQLPFHFSGGFALSTKSIGGILSVQGVIQMIATLVVFPIVNRRMGSLWTYRVVVLLYPLLYLLVPYVSLLPPWMKLPAVYVVLVWKVTSQAFAFPSSSIMLANSASSSKFLGTLNGAAASAASASRAFGPTFSGLLQAAGLSFNTLGLPWWVNALVALLGAAVSMLMVEEKRRTFVEPEKERQRGGDACALDRDEDHDCESDYLPLDVEDLASAADCASGTPNGESSRAVHDDLAYGNVLIAPTSPILTRLSLELRRQSRGGEGKH